MVMLEGTFNFRLQKPRSAWEAGPFSDLELKRHHYFLGFWSPDSPYKGSLDPTDGREHGVRERLGRGGRPMSPVLRV